MSNWAFGRHRSVDLDTGTWTLHPGTLTLRHIHKPRVMPLESHRDISRRAVTVLGHDQVRLARTRGLTLVSILPVQQDDDVGILLERSRLAQVTHHRPLVGPLLRPAVQLADGDDRDFEFLGEK